MMRAASPTAETYENRLSGRDESMVYYPIKLYGVVGEVLWKAPFVKDLFKRIYGPIVNKLGQRGDLGMAIRLVDLRFWNAVTFICLGIFILLTLFSRTPGKSGKGSPGK